MTDPLQLVSALSNDTRLRIVVLLSVAGELCVCDLATTLQLVQPRVSRQLALLREAGLVVDRRAGQWVHYRIDPDLSDWVQELLQALLRGARERQPYARDVRRLEKNGRRQGCE